MTTRKQSMEIMDTQFRKLIKMQSKLKNTSTFLMFLVMFLSMDFRKQTHSGVMGAIASVGEPDWSISKADLVDYFYSYEPFEPGREFRSIFPFFRQPQPQQQTKPGFPMNPTSPHSRVIPPHNAATNRKQSQQLQPRGTYLPPPNPTQQPPISPSQRISQSSVKFPSDPYQNQPQGQPSEQRSNNHQQPLIKLLPQSQHVQSENLPPPPSSPKYTKFSLNDKKVPGLPANLGDNAQYSYEKQVTGQEVQQQGNNDQQAQKPIYGPPPVQPPPLAPATSSSQNTNIPGLQTGGGGGMNYLPESTAIDSQTIVWPQNVEDNLTTDPTGETQVRFLVHKPGDEGVIRNALLEDGKQRNQEVKFIEGPMLRIQRHQKVYLPPKKKTVVYILLKEPQIVTDVEVVGPTEEPVPEVFITYQKSDGAVRTKHYSPEVVKNDKYLMQLRSSAVNAVTQPYAQPKLPSGSQPETTTNNIQTHPDMATPSPDYNNNGGLPLYYDYLNSNNNNNNNNEGNLHDNAASTQDETVIKVHKSKSDSTAENQTQNQVKRSPVHIRTARGNQNDKNESRQGSNISNEGAKGTVMCPNAVNVKTQTGSPSTKVTSITPSPSS